MLDEILKFVVLVLWSLTPHDVEDVPGLADLPVILEEQAAAIAALADSGRPDVMPPGEGTSDDAGVAVAGEAGDNPVGAPPDETPADGAEAPPVDAPPVDAPPDETPADGAEVPPVDAPPVEVELPEQAGDAGPPEEVPAEDASATGACAAAERGPAAAGCAEGA